MAVKKTTTKTSSATKTAPKKAAKVAAPKAAAKKAAPKKAPVKKAPAVKLTDKQAALLKMISEAKDAGYPGDKKAEAKVIEALQTKKLIKRGAKDKTIGTYRYMVSKAGAKHLMTPPAPPSAPAS
jgi:hypothetical protein